MVHPPPSSTGPHSRLNGWKEIAAYLGKGVRTVQRWERQYAMPVHRVGNEGGEIVFAYRQEVDDWIAHAYRARHEPSASPQAEEASAGPGRLNPVAEITTAPSVDVSSPGAPAGSSPARPQVAADPDASGTGVMQDMVSVSPGGANRAPGGPHERSVAFWTAMSMLTALLGVGIGYLLASGGLQQQPATATVAGNVLQVFDADGTKLWEHAFGGDHASYDPSTGQSERPLHVVDLEQDGTNEVVVVVRAHRKEDRVLHVFEADGDIRFTFRPDGAVRFGDTTYSPPWLAKSVFVTREPDGSAGLWTVFTHGLLFPCRLDRLDSRGNVRETYWSNGYIEWVDRAKLHGRNVLLVGGITNEFRTASLAVFPGAAGGSAPAGTPKYRCTSCPPGGPATFLVFPRGCLGEQMHAPSFVSSTIVHDSGEVAVTTATIVSRPGETEPIPYFANYLFGRELRPASVEVGVGAMLIHDTLFRDGALDHRFGEPDHRAHAVVRHWDGRGFAEFPPAPVFDESRPAAR